ncbi:hypothetical protein K450DRAFT_284387 [Umbelopsis ramanniana AG]|uniref:Zn(2)-C6 fungal-type domain-containing protein n=1 Tax=Umbelopsis ramanniana AG TaxID=1314678 RepID=A0AAD5H853_UMBRA|nr:uncharacterized protein K450DRAFT_284387 [Umbelopsis ramanniana AG]KAI8575402.1 hypothetical protein K450DRAFT_284387 [Umbelopsis ramanniana AG]
MSSNVSLPDFDEHQFLVNSLQTNLPQSRANTQMETTSNDYSVYHQQQPINMMGVPNHHSENIFEPSFGYATLSPRSSRLGSGATFSTDFGYLAADTTDHKQYNWLYDSMDAYMPTMNNVDGDFLVNSLMQQQQDSCFTNEAIETAIGGMSCNYVSMNDVNSLVSDIDCKNFSGQPTRVANDKHQMVDEKMSAPSSNSPQYSSIFSSKSGSDTSLSPKHTRSFSSSETSNNSDEDSEVDDLFSSRQSDMFTAWRNPPAQDKKIFIKIKKSQSSGTLNSKSLGQRKLSKKSFTNLYLTSVNQAKNMGKRTDKARRKFESPPHSARSTSSLASLTQSSNALTLSDSITRDLACHGASEEEEEDDTPYVDDEDDEDDDDYRHATAISTHNHSKKGRNVDKACNHCKRSHLRCDDMRPCKRCVSTGKTGCKDVEHKPRGRPKIHKK